MNQSGTRTSSRANRVCRRAGHVAVYRLRLDELAPARVESFCERCREVLLRFPPGHPLEQSTLLRERLESWWTPDGRALAAFPRVTAAPRGPLLPERRVAN